MTNQRTLWKTAAAAALSITLSAFAQNGTSEDTATDNSWVGTITTEPTAVRCGANESYYPLKFLSMGDVVRVVGKRQEWYQIVTGGKSFAGVVGYIKYPEKSASVFMVEGSIGTSTGEIEVIAKNIESNEMYRSWRPVYRLHAGDTVEIMSTEKKESGTLHREAYIVHTVKLPASATAWIRVSNVERATNPTLGEGGEDNLLGYETIAYSEADASENSGLPVNEVEELKTLTLSELEEAWTTISQEPVMGAETAPLFDLYGQLLEENVGDLVIERIASSRMKQLEVWKQLKLQKDRITALQAKLGTESGAVSEYIEVMDTYGNYAIVGKIALSSTFNGKIRPFMYRIQNSAGRTIGYLPANPNWDFSSLIGQVIGVDGEMVWDAAWRVNIVDATGFDLLAPTTAEARSDIQ
jgi:hypothetical protein